MPLVVPLKIDNGEGGQGRGGTQCAIRGAFLAGLSCFSFFLRAEKAHKILAHKTLSGDPGHQSNQSGTGQKIYVPWVLRIAHKSLTSGHPTRRLPPTGRSPAKKIYIYVPFPFLIFGGGLIMNAT